jgi:hypothetical protein
MDASKWCRNCRELLASVTGRQTMLPRLQDVDHLKRINDAHGHQAYAVRRASSIISKASYGHRRSSATARRIDHAAGRGRDTAQSDHAYPRGSHPQPVDRRAEGDLAARRRRSAWPARVGRAPAGPIARDQALMLAKTRTHRVRWDTSVTTSTRWRRIKADESIARAGGR